MNRPKVIFSNQTERLYEHLRDSLFFESPDPFTRRWVILPSPSMEQWLLHRLACDPKTSIACGLETFFLDYAVRKLQGVFQFHSSTAYCPTLEELSLALQFIFRSSFMPGPIEEYLGSPGSNRFERRIGALSLHLAHLFLQYDRYSEKIWEEWKETSEPHWQASLWNAVQSQYPSWALPGRRLKEMTQQIKQASGSLPTDIQIHLFALSYVPPGVLHFFSNIAPEVPVHFYVLSPSEQFWSDICSDRQVRWMERTHRERGASEAQLEDLEALLLDRNPLLANLGRLGREYSRMLEEEHAQTVEDYVIDPSCAPLEEYRDYLPIEPQEEEFPHQPRLLERLQADLLVVRAAHESIPIPEGDTSIQVHSAPSKLREVEILYNNLLFLIDQHKEDPDPLLPQDIIVMAPELTDYWPYLQTVFGAEDSQLPMQVLDLQLQAQSPEAQVLIALVELASSRWELSRLLNILSLSPVRSHWKFSKEDLDLMRLWLQEAGVRWGVDPAHRSLCLERDLRGISGRGEQGTWTSGLRRLLFGLVNLQDEECWRGSLELPCLPVSDVDFVEGDLLGKLVDLIHSLCEDLHCFTTEEERSLVDWIHYLQCLMQAYCGEEACTRLDWLWSPFLTAQAQFPQNTLRFSHLWELMQHQMKQSEGSFGTSRVDAVRFCSLLPMRAIPAKVVALLGLGEGSFPRVEKNRALNLMHGNRQYGYWPSRLDYDRSLFLEAILSARGYLLMSYVGMEDGTVVPPSLLVSEVLSYLKRAYSFEMELCIEHPSQAFSTKYFDGRHPQLHAYRQKDFQLSQVQHHQTRSIPKVHLSQKNEGREVDLRFLMQVARNPIQSYCQRGLGVYLPWEEEREDEEALHLSALDRALLRREGMQHSPEQVMEWARKKEVLPQGALGELSQLQLEEELVQVRSLLNQLDVGTPVTWELRRSCTEKTQIREDLWEVPALELVLEDGQQVFVVGRIPMVTEKGLLHVRKARLPQLISLWPRYLAYAALQPEMGLVCLEEGRILPPCVGEPREHLQTLLLHALRCTTEFCPLIPEWVEKLLASSESFLSSSLSSQLDSEWSPVFNDYLIWIAQNHPDQIMVELLEPWRESAQKLYGPLVESWMTKRSKR